MALAPPSWSVPDRSVEFERVADRVDEISRAMRGPSEKRQRMRWSSTSNSSARAGSGRSAGWRFPRLDVGRYLMTSYGERYPGHPDFEPARRNEPAQGPGFRATAATLWRARLARDSSSPSKHASRPNSLRLSLLFTGRARRPDIRSSSRPFPRGARRCRGVRAVEGRSCRDADARGRADEGEGRLDARASERQWPALAARSPTYPCRRMSAR